MAEELCILEFNTVDEAIEFAKELNPKSIVYEEMLDENQEDEAWICVLAICDICGRKNTFFAPAEIYAEGIEGVECIECKNMSVYPAERGQEDG